MKRIDEVTRVDSCINRAADDEPIFVLRANDPLAPYIVRLWACLYMRESISDPPAPVLTPEQVAKTAEARNVADCMEEWQAAHGIRSVTPS